MGVPSKVLNEPVLLKHIEAIDKANVREEAWVEELMWNDPRARGSGVKGNTRGEGVYEFGADVTKKFIEDNNLRMLIRAHDMRKDGFQRQHADRLVTLFSAPNYEDEGNLGAFARFIETNLNKGMKLQNSTFLQYPDRKNVDAKTFTKLRKRVVRAGTSVASSRASSRAPSVASEKAEEL